MHFFHSSHKHCRLHLPTSDAICLVENGPSLAPNMLISRQLTDIEAVCLKDFLHMSRWLLVGTYVGFATVGVFVAWYMYTSFFGIDLSQDGHSTVTWHQLTHWNQCSQWKGFQVLIFSWFKPTEHSHPGKIPHSDTFQLGEVIASSCLCQQEMMHSATCGNLNALQKSVKADKPTSNTER